MKYLRLSPMPVCCGADILGYFGWSTTNANSMGPRDLRTLEADLQEADKMSHVGMRLATLSEDQVPHVEYLLEKYGYKVLVRDFFNPGHSKKLTLYGKVYHKTKTTKEPDLRFHGKDERVNNETPRTPATIPASQISRAAPAAVIRTRPAPPSPFWR